MNDGIWGRLNESIQIYRQHAQTANYLPQKANEILKTLAVSLSFAPKYIQNFRHDAFPIIRNRMSWLSTTLGASLHILSYVGALIAKYFPAIFANA